MVKHSIRLEDGTVIRAGVGEPAILSVELTRTVNSGSQLQPGSVCAAMARITLFGQCPLAQSQAFFLDEEGEDGSRVALGKFFAEQPQNTGANTVTVTAYDTVTLLDRDVTGWLQDLTGWPYTLEELAKMVCGHCGVALSDTPILNGDHPVQAFTAQGITGRQLLQWIAQAACSYCAANGEGVLHFGWYTATDKTFTPADYFQGSLQMADYVTAPVGRVRISAKEDDVGTVCPEDAGEANTYTLLGNPLLTAETADSLKVAAQNIYERLQGVSYTPCTLQVPMGTAPAPGEIVSVTHKNGTTAKVYVMECRREGGRDVFSCTGAASLDSTTVVNDQSYAALSGKVLRLRADVEGLLAEHGDTKGNLVSLALELSGISATVQAVQEEQKTALTTMTQTAESLSVSVQNILDNGVDKVTNEFGLTIDGSAVAIHRAGSEMENRLDETGMYVDRGGDVILQANANGVVATDVSVRNYLVVGDHARFEDYGSDRTACFYV